MNQNLTRKLLLRFPVLYQDYYASMQETCMCWGFEHGDGWFDIVWQLSLAIEESLGYTWLQKRWFLWKRAKSRKWNDFVYWMSPPVKNKYKHVGKGTKDDPIRQELVERVYPRDQWLMDLLVLLLPDYRLGQSNSKPRKWWLTRRIGFWQELGLKALVWHPNTGFKVNQVKEKFGTLRYYCGTNNEIHAAIILAARASAVTCEVCGQSGTMRTDGWYSVRCDNCYGPKVPNKGTIPAETTQTTS